MGVYAGPANQFSNRTDSNRIDASTKLAVQSGLVLNLDAGASTSYVGSGTTWTNLVSGGSNGTIANGSYSSGNSGAIVFNGSNTYTSLPANSVNSNSDMTVSFWLNASTFATTNTILSGIDNQGYFQLRFRDTAVTLTKCWIAELGSFPAFTFATNRIYNVTITLTKGSPNDVGRIYVNGVAVAGSLTYATQSFSVSQPALGINYSYSPEPFSGNIYNFMSYNRVLSATEIQQNFNALRARFGI
jgi:hypothetical protein